MRTIISGGRVLGATLLMLLGGMASIAGAQTDEELAQRLSRLIDGIPAELERVEQRRELHKLAACLVGNDCQQAEQVAAQNHLAAPSPELRKAWLETATLLKQRVENEKKHAQKELDQLSLELKRVIQSGSVDEIQAINEQVNLVLSLHGKATRKRDGKRQLQETVNILHLFKAAVSLEAENEYYRAVQSIDQVIQMARMKGLAVQALQARRAQVIQKLEQAHAQYLTEGTKRILATRTAEEAKEVVDWMRLHAPSFSAQYAQKYGQKSAKLNQGARQWHSTLQRIRYSKSASRLDGLRNNSHLRAVVGQERLEQAVAEVEKLQTQKQDQQRKALLMPVNAIIQKADYDGKYEDIKAAVNLVRHKVAPEDRQAISALLLDLRYLSELKKLVKNYELQRLGEWMRAHALRPKHPWSAWVQQTQRQLAIEAAIVTGQIEKLEPRDDEDLSATLLRTADEMVQKKKWRQAHQLLVVFGMLMGPKVTEQRWFKNELAGTKTFVRAEFLERSGNLEAAVQAYQETFKHPGARSPMKEAEIRLNALQEKYPDLFKTD